VNNADNTSIESARIGEAKNDRLMAENASGDSIKSKENALETEAAAEPKVFSISELNSEIRKTVEGNFGLVWVQGEISNFTHHRSGHFYFSLKDKKASVSAVMFKGFNSKLKFQPENGAEVLVRGRITVYEPQGRYQVFCEQMEPVGLGALQMQFEQLKKKLEAEGLFAVERKRSLPALPKKLAVVTSPTGAAIRDILNVLARRYKGLDVTLVPASVQGEQASSQIVTAIELANRVGGYDVMIVGRGGGSIEDLWCFNDEFVARAIAASKIPIISAVGHEIDFTIADFVADLRAPTPSAAAELVVKNTADLQERIRGAYRQCRNLIVQKLTYQRQYLVGFEKRLVDPQRRLQDLSQRCDELILRLQNAIGRYFRDKKAEISLLREQLKSPQDKVYRKRKDLELCQIRLTQTVQKAVDRKKTHLAKLMSVLDSLSPLSVLDRGYSIVSKEGHVVKDAALLGKGDQVALRLAKGEASAEIKEVNKN
jgi:exodeoxyribonuclease VII large subunit